MNIEPALEQQEWFYQTKQFTKCLPQILLHANAALLRSKCFFKFDVESLTLDSTFSPQAQCTTNLNVTFS